MGVRIIGTGSATPAACLTNADMEKIVDTNEQWIVTRTGIQERRVMKQGEDIIDLIHNAGTKALAAADLKAQDLDAIIVATVSSDYAFPSTACLLQARLGIDGIPAFDVAAACSGFVYGLSVAQNYLQNGEFRRLLLVGADALSTMVNWQDRSTCVLFGDGAGAVVLSTENGEGGILSTVLQSSGSLWELLYVRAGQRQAVDGEGNPAREWGIQMKGPDLFKVAVRSLAEVTSKALAKAGLSPADVNLIVPHQANLRIIQAVAERLGMDKEKMYCNIEQYGNTSAASIPIALNEAIQAGRIHTGDVVVLNACGGGLTWGASVIRW
jgi:3-oxoacyl-[acyl-carrier-protein] synthase III